MGSRGYTMAHAPIHITGVLSVDHVQQGKVELCCLGSSGLYVSVALARLGHAVQFCSRIGEDFDQALLGELKADGIDWQLKAVAGPSAKLHLAYDSSGHIVRFQYEPGVGRGLEVEDLPDGFWAAPCVWLGAAEQGYHLEVARRASTGGRRVFLSPQGDYGSDWQGLSRLLPHLAGLFLNSREVQQVTGEPLPEAVLRLTEARPQLLCSITLGERGTFLVWRGTLFRVVVQRQPVVNATGAGDTYAAALVHCLLAGDSPEASLRFATTAAALSLRGFAFRAIPSQAQVLAELARRDSGSAVASAPLSSREAMRWLDEEEHGPGQDTMGQLGC